ncbi:MAG: TonB-dependent receptor [Rhodothermia bacterium]|nr:TonB-dependent receptor [Rhodothermia bacterium]
MRYTVLLFLLFCQSVHAQSISGKVMDAQNQTPLPGATIQIHTIDGNRLVKGATSDFNGRFAMSIAPDCVCVLRVSFIGYADFSQRLTTQDNIEIFLTPQRLQSDAVTITAHRAELHVNPITFSNLSASDLQTRPQTRDLPALLAELPSVTYYSENGNNIGYAYLRMRGFDQRRIAVSVNGIPQNDAEDHNVYWINFFDQQGAITDIQVQRGAGSAFYGATGIGGAINIVADPYKAQRNAQFTLGYGAFNTQRFSLALNSGVGKKGTTSFFRLSRVRSDGYRMGSWTDFWRYFAGIKHLKKDASLTIQAWGGPQKDGLAYYGIDKADNGDVIKRRANYSANFDEQEWFHQPHFEVLYDKSIAKYQTLSQKLYAFIGRGYFDFDATWRTPNFFRLPENWNNLGAAERDQDFYTVSPNTSITQRARVNNADIGWLPSWSYKSNQAQTTIGGEVRWHSSVHWGRIQRASADVPENLIGDADARIYQYRGGKILTALYASHLQKIGRSTQLQGDVQAVRLAYRFFEEAYFNNKFTVPYLFINPRLGLTINLNKSASLYGSFALANREPRLKELYDAEEAGAGSTPKFEVNHGITDFSRPLVKPEQLINTELGFAFRNDITRLSVNGYFMGFRNEIVPSGGLDQFGVPRYGNAAQTQHIGIEAEGAIGLIKGLETSGNISWGKHIFVQFTEYDQSGTPLLRDGNPISLFPNLTANLRLSFRHKAIFMALSAQHTGAFCVDNGGCSTADPNDTNDAFTVINATLQFQPSQIRAKNLQLSIDLNNLLNDKILLHGNESRTFFPLATRNVFAQLRYTIE